MSPRNENSSLGAHESSASDGDLLIAYVFKFTTCKTISFGDYEQHESREMCLLITNSFLRSELRLPNIITNSFICLLQANSSAIKS